MMTAKNPTEVTKRVKTIRRDLQSIAEDYRAEKISLALQHVKALRQLDDQFAEKARHLQDEINNINININDSLAS